MNLNRSLLVVLIAAVGLVSVPARAQFGPEVVVTPAPIGLAPGAFEIDAAYDPFGYARTSEPHVIINPKNPNNLVMTHLVIGASTKRPRVFDVDSPNIFACGVSVSFDRGHTWRSRVMTIPLGLIPTTKVPLLKGYDCAETHAAFASDGTVYMVGLPWNPGLKFISASGTGAVYSGFPDEFRYVAMWKSSDGGRTWSTAWQVLGPDHTNNLIDRKVLKDAIFPAMGLNELTIDPVTGDMLLVGWGGGKVPKEFGPYSSTLEISHDKGRTWTKPVPVNSPEFPMTFGWGTEDARDGVIAIIFPVISAPKENCPCAVLALSRDGGKTFTRRKLPVTSQLGGGFQPFTGPSDGLELPQAFVRLDPTHRGRLAAMVVNADDTALLVLTSDDFGKTWSPPTRIGVATYGPVGKPAPKEMAKVGAVDTQDAGAQSQILAMARAAAAKMNRVNLAYGPQGVLAVMWRQNYPPALGRLVRHALGPQDVYAAVSFNGGHTFSAPIKANSAPSGWDTLNNFPDDYSSLTVDENAVHVGWGDMREHDDQSAWYAQIPLADFR